MGLNQKIHDFEKSLESLSQELEEIKAQAQYMPVAIPEDVRDFLVRVSSEVKRAREKFPNPAGLMTALTEEVGELAKACLDEDMLSIHDEAMQVAAMAVRMATEGDPSLNVVRQFRGLEIWLAKHGK